MKLQEKKLQLAQNVLSGWAWCGVILYNHFSINLCHTHMYTHNDVHTYPV